jgi:hypothetical protein
MQAIDFYDVFVKKYAKKIQKNTKKTGDIAATRKI